MLGHLATALEGVGIVEWSGFAYRHISPSFDPLSTQGAELHGGRWNAPGIPALYLATSPEVARAEFDRLVRLRAQSASDFHPRNLATIHLDLKLVIDVRTKPILQELGVDASNYENFSQVACRTAGSMTAEAGLAGLLAPSATGTGTILVAFPQNFSNKDSIEITGETEVDWT